MAPDQQTLRIVVVGGDPSVWVGLSAEMGSQASQIFVPRDSELEHLAARADDIDIVVVVGSIGDPDPCAPLRVLNDTEMHGRTLFVAPRSDHRTAAEATAIGVGGYIVWDAVDGRLAGAIRQVAAGGMFLDAPASGFIGGPTVKRGEGAMAAARALAYALELKDTYTGAHAERVTALAMRLAEAAGLPDAAPDESLETAFLLHDVGKIGTPESILGKPGALTDTERRVLQTHTILGERIVAPLGLPDCVRQVVRHHHERWDGTGYPDRLMGAEIPTAARIFTIADVIDAMTSFRPYRRPVTMKEAVGEVVRNAGTQFDPAIATLAEDVFLDNTLELLTNRQSAF